MTSYERVRNEGERGPSVSVVITSVDRRSLLSAVASAINQDRPPHEVIVVFDRDDGVVPVRLPTDPHLVVLHTGARNGPSAARQLGADHATGDLVAFLDDDDVWTVDKLRQQVARFEELSHRGQHVVVSCRAEMRTEAGQFRGIEPVTNYEEGTDVADYLFVRHSLFSGGFGLASSTLLCDARLLKEVPWDASLRLHEDWDWVCRATRAGAVLSMVPKPLVVYRLQAAGAAASRPPGGWNRSADWARSMELSPTALGDFLLCISGVNAVAYGDRGAALSLARAAGKEARPSARGWAAFLTQLLLPPVVVRSAGAGARSVTARLGRVLARREQSTEQIR